MDAPSTTAATLAIWTIARCAAVAVLATEGLFLYARRRDARAEGPAAARVFWALTPALILAGLCLWCTLSLQQHGVAPPGAAVIASLAR